MSTPATLHGVIARLKAESANLKRKHARLQEERDQAVARAEQAERAERSMRLELDNLRNRMREAREFA